MSTKDIAIVFDCGATNLRVVAIDTKGNAIASHAFPNETDEDPSYPGGRIWDVEKLWGKLCDAAKIVTFSIDTDRIIGATITTFGVDGTLLDKKGNHLSHVISWQCDRTQPIIENISKYIPLEELYQISGVYPYAFNTINKMIWYKENKPVIFKESHRFLFMPSLFIHKLTGEMHNDVTMAGTSMMTSLENRTLSNSILSRLGLDESLFGELKEPGEVAGYVHEAASGVTGLPKGLPVLFAGHDTQFALFGSGAGLNQPVLSSGTWEVLMARTKVFKTSNQELLKKLTTETDALPHVFNIGQNWLGSGILEWFHGNFYPELCGDKLYETMISDADKIKPGQHGLQVNPDFYKENTQAPGGSISGLTINTNRSEIYRAILESLAFRLRDGLEALQEAGDFKAEHIICVGGGSKNRLWNQLRADVCNTPIQLIGQKETTVLGAALFVFAGTGIFDTVHDARKQIPYNPTIVKPSGNARVYGEIYSKHN